MGWAAVLALMVLAPLAWKFGLAAVLVPVVLLVLAGAGARFTLFSGYQARRIRWRVRLRLKPGPGFASLGEIVFRWALLAALRHGGRARPGMSLTDRLMSPRPEYAIRLGRAQYGINTYGRQEDMILVMTGPRGFKTALLGDWLMDWRGAAVVTETRPDLLEATAGWRAARYGPVHYFNPENVAGYTSTFRWGLTIGCDNPAEALRRAADMVDAVATEGDMQWWAEKAASALAAAMHAAALTGNDITEVWAWANGRGERMMEEAARHPDVSPELFGTLREIRGTGKTAESVRITMSKALAWVAVPAMRDMVTGPEAVPFNVGAWIESRGTIYMLAPGGDDGSTVAPLFRCFASFVHRAAKAHAQMQRGRRLDPRLLFALDELHMCPVNLPAWSSDSAGSGIEVIAVVHSPGQMVQKYGEPGTRTVMSNMLTKVLLPGIHDTELLGWAQTLAGRLPGDGGDGKQDWVMPVDAITRLPLKRALVFRGNLTPTVLRIRPWWTRKGVRWMRLTGGMLQPPRRAGVYLPVTDVEEELDAFPVPALAAPGRVPASTATWPVPVEEESDIIGG